jgi:hypothetical protein
MTVGPVALVLLLTAGVVLTGAFVFWSEARILLRRRDYLWLAFVVALATIARAPVGGRFFLGLEYEDAYIFTAASRYLLYAESPAVEPLRARTCVVGSLIDCQWDGNAGSGHFLVVPALGYLSHRVFGYSPYAISVINLLASLLSVPVLYLFCTRISRSFVASAGASAFYAVCPAISLFHTSGLAETVSSLVVLLHAYAVAGVLVDGVSGSKERKAMWWILLTASFVLGIATKRENLVTLLLPVVAIVISWGRGLGLVRRGAVWLLLAIPITLWMVIGFRIIGIETGESGDIHAPTFSFRYILALMPLFWSALLTTKWFVGFPAFFAIGMTALWRRQLRASGVLIPAALSLAYFVVYTSHYRSYYFVVHGFLDPFEALRYLTNMFPWVAAMAGIGALEVTRWFTVNGSPLARSNRMVALGLAALWIGVALWSARGLRREWQAVEMENRIQPVVSALAEIGADQRYVLTDLPVVAQVFGDEHVRLIDAQSVGGSVPTDTLSRELGRVASAGWWLRTNDDSLDRLRYPGLYKFVERMWVVGACKGVSEWISLCHLRERALVTPEGEDSATDGRHVAPL